MSIFDTPPPQPIAATVTSCKRYRQPVGATIQPTGAATIAPCKRM